MRKREANFTPVFQSWLRNVHKKTCAWELKVTQDDSWPFSRLEEHQERWLMAATRDIAVYKISDESIGHKPFDGFSLCGVPAYVVILYSKSNTFHVIPIESLVFYRDKRAKRKSLTEKEAQSISIISVKLGK